MRTCSLVCMPGVHIGPAQRPSIQAPQRRLPRPLQQPRRSATCLQARACGADRLRARRAPQGPRTKRGLRGAASRRSARARSRAASRRSARARSRAGGGLRLVTNDALEPPAPPPPPPNPILPAATAGRRFGMDRQRRGRPLRDRRRSAPLPRPPSPGSLPFTPFLRLPRRVCQSRRPAVTRPAGGRAGRRPRRHHGKRNSDDGAPHFPDFSTF